MNTESISTIENLSLIHSDADYFSRFERIIADSKVGIHIQMYIF
jgi:hypothetical protein